MMNPGLLNDLSNGADFLKIVYNAIKEVGLEDIDHKSREWFEKAEFTIKLQSEYLFLMKRDAFVSYANQISKQSDDERNLASKYLLAQGITGTISKIAFLVYNNPKSPLVQFLLNGELGQKGLIEEKVKKDGTRIINLEWKKYNLSIFEILDELKEKIQSKRDDERKKKILAHQKSLVQNQVQISQKESSEPTVTSEKIA